MCSSIIMAQVLVAFRYAVDESYNVEEEIPAACCSKSSAKCLRYHHTCILLRIHCVLLSELELDPKIITAFCRADSCRA